MSESARGMVAMQDGPLAEVIFNGDGTYQVEKIIRKSTLGKASLRDVGRLIAELPLDKHGTARVDLV
jgi:hypothetical protein